MDDLVIIAAGGFGRTVASLIDDINTDGSKFNILGFIDDSPSEENVELAGRLGLEVLGGMDRLGQFAPVHFSVAHGSGSVRHELASRAVAHGHRPATVIHPTASIGRDVELGPGATLAHHAIVTTNVRTGAGCLHNMFSIVGHDCRLGAYVTLSPFASMLGGSSAEDRAWLATKSTLDVNRRLGRDSLLAASAVAVRDVPPDAVARGLPARWKQAEGVAE